jgi:hypothetical protein
MDAVIENICRELESELGQLGLKKDFEIENYLDSNALDKKSVANGFIKSQGVNKNIQSVLLKKLGISDKKLNYNYRSERNLDSEKQLISKLNKQREKFGRRKHTAKLLDIFKLYENDKEAIKTKTFSKFLSDFKNEHSK